MGASRLWWKRFAFVRGHAHTTSLPRDSLLMPLTIFGVETQTRRNVCRGQLRPIAMVRGSCSAPILLISTSLMHTWFDYRRTEIGAVLRGE